MQKRSQTRTALPTPRTTSLRLTHLPTPPEMYSFLVQHFQIACQDPSQPFANWPEEPVHQPAFSVTFVQELRDRNRQRLLAFDDAAGEKDSSQRVRKEGLRDSRRRAMKKVEKHCPSSDDLFQIAGAHTDSSNQRVLASLGMAGISKTTLKKSLGLSKFSEFIQGDVAHHSRLPDICDFLRVDLEWVKLGPKQYTPSLYDGRSPWWLYPWRAAREEAANLFLAAERLALLSLQNNDQYDFLSFWSKWATNPESLRIDDHGALYSKATSPAAEKPTKQKRVSVTQAVDAIPSLLPWLFLCRSGFNTGDPTFPVHLTPDTLRTLAWMVNYYHINLMGTNLAGTLPVGPAPTADDVSEAMSRLFTGGESHLTATGNGRSIRLIPPFVPAPKQLPSDVDRPMPGPRRGSRAKKLDGASS